MLSADLIAAAEEGGAMSVISDLKLTLSVPEFLADQFYSGCDDSSHSHDFKGQSSLPRAI